MDYLSANCAELVPFEIVQTSIESRPYPAGTEWAEPDLDAASAALRTVYRDLEGARRKAEHGRSVVMRLYGAEAAARNLHRRLTDRPTHTGNTARRTRIVAHG